jgi:hypothetical protein
LKRLPASLAFSLLIAVWTAPHVSAEPHSASPDFGAHVFLLGHPGTTQRDLQLMSNAGLSWAKIIVEWRSIEGACKGCLEWGDLDRVVSAATGAGVKVLARVDFQPGWARGDGAANGPPDNLLDYADFVSVLADRYRAGSPRGTIDAIEVWNEPNLSREWGGQPVDQEQAVRYVAMLGETYQKVKAVDPDKIVVSAGLSPTGTDDGTAKPDDAYLDWLYQAGLAQVCDVVGLHAPGYGSPPETELNSDPRFPHPSFYFRRIEQLRALMEAYGDAEKQIWLLEFGWTTDQVHPDYSWYAVTPDQQADYIVRAFEYVEQNWSPWIGVMFIWNIPDPNWTPDHEQYWWSITNPDGSPRPAYEAMKSARGLDAVAAPPPGGQIPQPVGFSVRWMGSPNRWGGRPHGPPIALVLHTMAGHISGADAWFATSRSKASSHYGISLDGHVHQYVDLGDRAWANGNLEPGHSWPGPPRVNPNHLSVSIETEDRGDIWHQVTDAQYSATLEVSRLILSRYPQISYLVTHRAIAPRTRPHDPSRWVNSGRFAALAAALGLRPVV